MTEPRPETRPETQRIDKWLWYARFVKSRSLAAKLCRSHLVRINRVSVNKASHGLKLGDVLTFPIGRRIRVVRIVRFAARRGAALEAQTLYEDLTPPVDRSLDPTTPTPPSRTKGSGRPTKADRRAIDALLSSANS